MQTYDKFKNQKQTSNLENRQQQPHSRTSKIMKNVEMNKTKGMSLDETALVFIKKLINMGGS